MTIKPDASIVASEVNRARPSMSFVDSNFDDQRVIAKFSLSPEFGTKCQWEVRLSLKIVETTFALRNISSIRSSVLIELRLVTDRHRRGAVAMVYRRAGKNDIS